MHSVATAMQPFYVSGAARRRHATGFSLQTNANGGKSSENYVTTCIKYVCIWTCQCVNMRLVQWTYLYLPIYIHTYNTTHRLFDGGTYLRLVSVRKMTTINTNP